MKDVISRTVLMAGLVMMSVQAFGWGQEGHRIVAQIAYDNMSCVARRHVDKVLGKGGMVYVSTWADEIKSDTIYPSSHTWHYQDLNAGMSDSAVVSALTIYPNHGGNLYRAMDSVIVLLKDDRSNKDALAFLIHLVGDRYCPMHSGHEDDLGGNKVEMRWFGQKTNLHTVWDTKLIASRGYSYSEYAFLLEERGMARIRRIQGDERDVWCQSGGYKTMRKSIRRASDEELALRNYAITEHIYSYQTTWNGNAYHYAYRWTETMEQQLYTAGIRLAQILNRLYR